MVIAYSHARPGHHKNELPGYTSGYNCSSCVVGYDSWLAQRIIPIRLLLSWRAAPSSLGVRSGYGYPFILTVYHPYWLNRPETFAVRFVPLESYNSS